MFTGLVQSLGKVRTLEVDGQGGVRLRVDDAMAVSLQLGESIAVNGCCLSVVSMDESSFEFQVGPETLARTSLGGLVSGSRVNLERALRMGDSLGGHFVSGHVDAVGTLRERMTSGEWQTVWFDCPVSLDDLMVTKGSICVDGVSLTLVDVIKGSFSVMLIPHTLASTTLGFLNIDDAVNLEADLLAKHIRKLMANNTIKF